MKIKDFARRFVDEAPGFNLTDEMVEGWLIRLDGFIRHDLRSCCTDSINRDSELIMTGKYEEAYFFWCKSKVYYKEEIFGKYSYYVCQFRSCFEDYQRSFREREDIFGRLLVTKKDAIIDHYELMLGITEEQ